MATNRRGRVGLVGTSSKAGLYRKKVIEAAEAAGRKKEFISALQMCNSWQAVVSLAKSRNLEVNFE